MSERRLRSIAVDADTGEVVEACAHVRGCAHCQDREHELETLRGKYNGALSQIGRMKSDKAADAERHARWLEAETVHCWWAIATGHFKSEFDANHFYDIAPRLKKRGGLEEVLKAIAGAAYEPSKKELRNGKFEVFDSLELITRSAAKTESFAHRAPGPKEHSWKTWLLARIESNLTTKETE